MYVKYIHFVFEEENFLLTIKWLKHRNCKQERRTKKGKNARIKTFTKCIRIKM